jgi:hypothetical protein
MLLSIRDARLAFSQLLREFARHLVDRGVEIIVGVFRINIGTGNCKMHLNDMVAGRRFIMKEDDMSGENAIRELLQVIYLLRHVRVDGCGKSQMSGAEVDLHAKKIMKFRKPARKNNPQQELWLARRNGEVVADCAESSDVDQELRRQAGLKSRGRAAVEIQRVSNLEWPDGSFCAKESRGIGQGNRGGGNESPLPFSVVGDNGAAGTARTIEPGDWGALFHQPRACLQSFLDIASRLEFAGTHKLHSAVTHGEHPTEELGALKSVDSFAPRDSQSQRSEIRMKISAV